LSGPNGSARLTLSSVAHLRRTSGYDPPNRRWDCVRSRSGSTGPHRRLYGLGEHRRQPGLCTSAGLSTAAGSP